MSVTFFVKGHMNSDALDARVFSAEASKVLDLGKVEHDHNAPAGTLNHRQLEDIIWAMENMMARAILDNAAPTYQFVRLYGKLKGFEALFLTGNITEVLYG